MGGGAVAQLKVEGVEELALEIFGDRGEARGQGGEFAENAVILAGLWLLLGQRLELLGLGLAGTRQVCVPPLKPFAEVAVDVVVARRNVVLDLGEHIVLPLVEVEDLLLQTLKRRVVPRDVLCQPGA
ncbi:hypothetical protein IL992_43445 [Microbispora sp. NEAU-D428]|uniref:hypothetical protein n=1 Tax=Microbispora sitophila TaxID=2771537 RepID=UPI001867F212|nr:hypothetical protein [Microbispora sitophila]MBE3015964.1 hypothetical protein [Microbispora sitophila]